MDKKFFFILGRGRSGSWLLKSILDAHPEICCAPEALFIIHVLRKYQCVQSFSEKNLEKFVNDIWLELRIRMWWKIDKNELLDDLKKNVLGKSFQEVCVEVYAHYARMNEKSNAGFLGDKNPTYTLFIRELAELFPEAKFISLVRDHRDNILSYQQVGFDLQSTSALAGRWNDYHKQIMHYSKELNARFLIVKYEDLLFQPSETVQSICSFLGVNFLPEMLEFFKDPRNVPAWNEKIRNPLVVTNAFKWKSKMTSAEIEKADFICGDLAKQLGYEILLGQKGFLLWIKTIRGRIRSSLSTLLEKLIFRLPLKWRMRILNNYRESSGTLEEMSD